MQKIITKTIILLAVLTLALSVNYIFAAWTGPTEAPPGGNTPTPIHIGTTDQVKDGGLSLTGLSVFGGGYFQGNVGVGVVTPIEALEVAGNIKTTEGIKVGNTIDTDAGTIRWTGTDFEGYDGTEWKSLTAEGGTTTTIVSTDYTECVGLGGSWVEVGQICYIAGTSCPSGWEAEENYSSTVPNSGSSGGIGSTCNFNAPRPSCTTGSHTRENSGVESCSYGYKSQCNTRNCNPNRCTVSSVSATQTEIGCTKN
jgi:hypothetical protein